MDGSGLLWTPDTKEQCEYLPHKTFPGKLQYRTWLSDNGEFALTFTKPKRIEQTQECGGYVDIADQGIACKQIVSSRVKRQSEGTVLSTELNSRLQALETRISTSYNYAFQASVKVTCKNMQNMVQLLLTSLERNPNLAVRHMLNQTYIYSVLLHNYVFIYPCIPIDSYTILSSNDCTERIPMSVPLAGLNETLYLDTHDNILHDSSAHIDCALDRQIPLMLEGQLYYYNHRNAESTTIDHVDTINLISLDFSATLMPLGDPVIHDVILYDWHLFRDKFSLNDITGALRDHSNILHYLENAGNRIEGGYADPAEFAQHTVKDGLFGFLSLGSFDIKQLWIFLCCLIVTLRVFVVLVRMCTGARAFWNDPSNKLRQY